MFTFQIDSNEGTTIAIEYTDNLANPVWQILEVLSLGVGVNQVSDAMVPQNGKRFYRIRKMN